MRCPACKKALKKVSVLEIGLDVCEDGCGGIWFEAFELKKFEIPSVEKINALLDLRPCVDRKLKSAGERRCPRCTDPRPLAVRKYGPVEIDQCEQCWGAWLDWGELAEIREHNLPIAADQAAASPLNPEAAIALAQAIGEIVGRSAQTYKETYLEEVRKYTRPSRLYPRLDKKDN